MLQLYYWPMACSLASRIALMEAGIEARYHAVHLWDKRVIDDGRDFWAVSAKGAVPVLVLEDGEQLTENPAILQYIADLRPEKGLAPPHGDKDRYRLQEWLGFVGTEIHKAFLFPTFWYANDAAKASARERIDKSVAIVAGHLAEKQYLVGERFTVADAYLTWALLLLGRGGVEIATWPSLVAFLDRVRARPRVEEAIRIELELRRKFPAQMARSSTG